MRKIKSAHIYSVKPISRMSNNPEIEASARNLEYLNKYLNHLENVEAKHSYPIKFRVTVYENECFLEITRASRSEWDKFH